MKAEIKELWLKALRSGEYDQIQGILHDGSGYCCLGVLYVCLGETPKLNDEGEYEFNTQTHALDTDTLKLVELSYHTSVELAEMNDNGYTFTKIADWIEENL